MENIMMLPASYCVMNEEEMTYTTGSGAIHRSGCLLRALSSPFTMDCRCFQMNCDLISARLIRTTGPARVLML